MAKILNIDGAKLNIDSTNIKDNYVLQPQLQVVASETSIDTIKTSGMYWLIENKASSFPPKGNYAYGSMFVMHPGPDSCIQLVFSAFGSSPAYRVYIETTGWSDWFYLSQTT